MDLKELRDQRLRAITRMRELNDAALAESRDFSAEEQSEYDRCYADSERLRTTMERETRQRDLERQIDVEPTGDGGGDNHRDVDPTGNDDRDQELRNHPRAQPEYRAAFRRFLRTGREERALQAGSDAEGGYTVAPIQFAQGLIKFIDDAVFVRRLATTEMITNAMSLGALSYDTDFNDADWTSELLTGSLDETPRFGRRSLTPHPLAKRTKISNKLIRASSRDVEGLFRDRLGYKFSITNEKGFLTGSGVQQPLGVFTASADGISTGRDVSTDNTTTAMTVDGLKEAKYTLKGGYWRNAQWAFHRDGVKQIAKLKDGEGRYLWEASVVAGEPDRLLSFPVNVSEFVPNTFTTGLYVGILGDWSFYWIVDALDMQVQRLVELYAETNQIGLIGRMETDGMPVLEEAFVRVTLA